MASKVIQDPQGILIPDRVWLRRLQLRFLAPCIASRGRLVPTKSSREDHARPFYLRKTCPRDKYGRDHLLMLLSGSVSLQVNVIFSNST
jgi:hypothetical protein